MKLSKDNQVEPENKSPKIDEYDVNSNKRTDPRPLPAPDVRRLDVDKVLERSLPSPQAFEELPVLKP